MHGQGAASPDPKPLVVAESVTVALKDRDIISGVDLSVGPGEIVAILGASGTGKTTLLSCLGGLQRPTSGKVFIESHEMSALSARLRARLRLRLIGFVFQHSDLLPELTPMENVMLPALLSGWTPQRAQGRAQELLEALEVSTPTRTESLSGGEAQRLALARALIMEPKVLLADEPTGSLDGDTRDDVLALLVDTARSAGTAAVIVTHDPVVAARADRSVLLNQGLRSAVR